MRDGVWGERVAGLPRECRDGRDRCLGELVAAATLDRPQSHVCSLRVVVGVVVAEAVRHDDQDRPLVDVPSSVPRKRDVHTRFRPEGCDRAQVVGFRDQRRRGSRSRRSWSRRVSLAAPPGWPRRCRCRRRGRGWCYRGRRSRDRRLRRRAAPRSGPARCRGRRSLPPAGMRRLAKNVHRQYGRCDDSACTAAERGEGEEKSQERCVRFGGHPFALSTRRTVNGLAPGGRMSNDSPQWPTMTSAGRGARVGTGRRLGEVVGDVSHLHVEHDERGRDVRTPGQGRRLSLIRTRTVFGAAARLGSTREA